MNSDNIVLRLAGKWGKLNNRSKYQNTCSHQWQKIIIGKMVVFFKLDVNIILGNAFLKGQKENKTFV